MHCDKFGVFNFGTFKNYDILSMLLCIDWSIFDFCICHVSNLGKRSFFTEVCDDWDKH